VLLYFYSMTIDLSSVRKVHFIGIGGIGVSALARMYLKSKAQVSGSDREADSLVISELRRLGAAITRGHRASAVPKDADLVIYTIAIPSNNPELSRARTLGLKTQSYPEALGQLSIGRPTIAISGTHGKTTTTAMVAEILVAARRDPLVVVGSLLNRVRSRRSNFIAGRGPLVVEACEYRRSFLTLAPTILVITNIDNDHLDYYRDLVDIQSAFAELAGKIAPTGALICDKRDPRLQPILLNTRCLTIDYHQFDKMADKLSLRVLGAHNRLNAAAALAVAKVLKINPSISHQALEKFKGLWRRLEYLGRTRQGARLYDDYGHHPTAIRATLAAVRRDLAPQRLIVVFQPHLYSRTKLLFKEFAESFSAADEILVLPIYAAREPVDKTISSRILASAIPRAIYVSSITAAAKRLTQTTGPQDLILTLGAGDVFVLGEKLRYNH